MASSEGAAALQPSLKDGPPEEDNDCTVEVPLTASHMQPAEPAQEELIAQIVKQVNFYFSDANLPTDAFLLKEVQKNPEGWGELLKPASHQCNSACLISNAHLLRARHRQQSELFKASLCICDSVLCICNLQMHRQCARAAH